MFSREQLLKITGLKLSARLDKMDDNRLEEYYTALNVFVDNFPFQESDFKNFRVAKNYDALDRTLTSIINLLSLIYAEDLAQSCAKLKNDVKTATYDQIETYSTCLLADISTLSIGIQMAQYREAASAEVSHAEHNTEVAERIILGVDDVSLTLNSLKSILQSTPYKFIGVTSGAAALKYLQTHTPELLIFDIEMPEMDGYELTQKVRELGQTAPIVFLTGNATKDYVLKAIQAGAAEFITKPINKDQVLEKIIRFMEW